MDILLIVSCCCLATLKVGIQSKASRTVLNGKRDVAAFNFGVFVVIALIFFYNVIGGSPEVWIYAFFFALFTVLFQLIYTEALSIGSVSLTVMIVNIGMVITVLFSKFVYNEKLTSLRIIGILLTIVTIVLVTDLKTKNKANKKWLVLAIITMLGNSAIGIVQKIFNSSVFAPQREAFISASYIVAFVLTVLVWLIMTVKNKEKAVEKSSKKFLKILPFVVACGATLGFFQWLSNYVLTIVDATVFFPTYSGGSIVLSTLVGVLLFKDKLDKKQFIGVLVGIVSIVLMNF